MAEARDSALDGLAALGLEVLLMTCAAALAFAVSGTLPRLPAPTKSPDTSTNGSVMIPNPVDHPAWSRDVLSRALGGGAHVLFGSSELTFGGETNVTKMFPEACGRPVVAIGRAGFQSLPILLTLAEARSALSPESDVTIILSPGWFAEFGTPSGAFLRYLKPGLLRELLAAEDIPPGVRGAIARQVRIHRDDLTGLYPDWVLPWLPGIATPRPPPLAEAGRVPRPPLAYDWDAAETTWRRHVVSRAGGNVLGVDKSYFDKWKGRTYPIAPPPLDPWRIEQSDVYALSEFLSAYGVRARFIVQPLHRRVYGDLAAYDALMDEVRAKLEADGHRWVSFFTEPYDLSLLEDSVHFSAYGWVRVQREMCR